MFQYINKRVKKVAIVSILSVIAFLSISFTDNYFEISKNIDIFTTLYKELNLYYVDETNPGELIKKAIDGMLESLDPFTSYIPESEIEDHRFQTTGQYGGIGATIMLKDNYPTITQIYENAPSQKADLKVGDKIIEIEGKSTKGKKTDETVKLLKGQPKTSVKVLIKREGESKPIEKTLIREEIKIESIPYYGMLNDTIGYVKLRSFTENCGSELEKALKDLKNNHKLKSLIFDLRGNPGGLLREAVNVSNLFIEKGKDIVKTSGRLKENEKTYKTLNTPFDTEMPIVVLVNSSSASASEIVSGAIQDYDRGVVLGQRTYGKGLVQQTRVLSYQSQLKLTISKYYLPSGRCVQARDYSNKKKYTDGIVGKIPDSLRTAFKTQNGRVVYDGSGVTPDVELPKKKYSNILLSLVSKHLIFDYVTKYCIKNPKIPAVDKFVFTDKDYEAFVNYLSDKEYDYTTKSEKSLEDLKKYAEKEKYFSAIEKEYNALKEKMLHDKKADLKKFKDEIIQFISEEIIGRYYYQKGKVQYSIQHDHEVKEAMNILNNKKMYQSILDASYKKLTNKFHEEEDKDELDLLEE